MARYETAFYHPLVWDWRPYETWREDGSRTATERATEIWKKVLAGYVPPPRDPAVREELSAYVDRRTAEVGAGSGP